MELKELVNHFVDVTNMITKPISTKRYKCAISTLTKDCKEFKITFPKEKFENGKYIYPNLHGKELKLTAEEVIDLHVMLERMTAWVALYGEIKTLDGLLLSEVSFHKKHFSESMNNFIKEEAKCALFGLKESFKERV